MYNPNPQWQDGAAGNTPITAAKLNIMEQGIDTAHDIAESASVTANDAAALAETKSATTHGHTAEYVGAIPAGDITKIDVVTQAEYDALAVKVETTLYVIRG